MLPTKNFNVDIAKHVFVLCKSVHII